LPTGQKNSRFSPVFVHLDKFDQGNTVKKIYRIPLFFFPSLSETDKGFVGAINEQ